MNGIFLHPRLLPVMNRELSAQMKKNSCNDRRRLSRQNTYLKEVSAERRCNENNALC